MSSDKKLIVICGATGNQGGSAVSALLKDGSYKIRGITRNPDSEAAKKLASQGVEMVKANAANKDELVAAFKGAHAVFANTNFFDPDIVMGDHALEEKQGKNMADAAEEAGVKHYIYSSLHPVHKISKGKYDKVVYFDGKARVEQYIREHKKLNTTFVEMGFYSSNFSSYMPPSLRSDGILEFAYPIAPNARLPLIDVPHDFGPVFLGVLKAGPEATKNKNILIAGEYTTPLKIVETFEKVTGRKAVYKQLDRETYKNGVLPMMGPVVSEIFTQMLEYFSEFGFFNGEDIEPTKKYSAVQLSTFESWLRSSGYTGPQ